MFGVRQAQIYPQECTVTTELLFTGFQFLFELPSFFLRPLSLPPPPHHFPSLLQIPKGPSRAASLLCRVPCASLQHCLPH